MGTTLKKLIENTIAYRIFCGDKKNHSFSHAYLIVCEDELALPEYLNIFAKSLLCETSTTYCDECRGCRLIEKNTHTDVTFYPKNEKAKILTADIDELISQTYLKPLEADKRIFVLCGAESMNASAQNKLLKTLEEPPENVYLIIGTSNESALLPTVKSRVKKLEIAPFSEDDIVNALKDDFYDEKKLKNAATFADGKPGLALAYLSGETALSDLTKFTLDVFLNMTSSADILGYSAKIDKNNIKEFFITVKKVLEQSIRGEGDIKIKEIAKTYPLGARLKIIEIVNDFERALVFNGNTTMLADKLLLSVLEEKYRWKKL